MTGQPQQPQSEDRSWLCYAHPAIFGGRRCGYLNNHPVLYSGLIVCVSCGCTKSASDSRKARIVGSSGQKPQPHQEAHDAS